MADTRPAKPRHHGRDHLPGGEDPIPNWPSGGAPSVATFWFDADTGGDTALTVTADSSHNIAWAHAALPSDGLITGPFISDQYVQFNAPCMTIEFMYTLWDATPTFPHAGVLGTDDRIGYNDLFALANAGIGGASGIGQRFGDATNYVRPNAHIANDLVHGYAYNGDTISHNVIVARLVIFAWAATGYTGGVPGYPQ